MRQQPSSDDDELAALDAFTLGLGSFAALLRSIAADADRLRALATRYGDMRSARKAVESYGAYADKAQTRAVMMRVARHYNVTVDDITNGSKRKSHAEARMVSMYLIRTLFGRTYPAIAELYWSATGDYRQHYNHTTVMSAMKTVRERMTRDEGFAETVDLLGRDIMAAGQHAS